MDLEADDVRPVTEKDCVVAETSRTRSRKKNQEKVPKRIHKADREKMKREHLNELFIELANVLELTEQNNGKASILGETTRLVKDILSQIECLKKENITLLSESQYVETEKKELEDENEALQRQIGELQEVLKEKMAQLKQQQLDLNIPLSESREIESNEQAPMVGPVYVIPLCSDLTSAALRPISGVCKPHARYPTPADSWPSKLLEKELVPSKECPRNGCDS